MQLIYNCVSRSAASAYMLSLAPLRIRPGPAPPLLPSIALQRKFDFLPGTFSEGVDYVFTVRAQNVEGLGPLSDEFRFDAP